ncbi:zinc metalloprotease [Cyanosarcina cf. burmensis CCALA 770]|nr:zinc metalloprotease [Cyanosarcina cf. burmensis CCALA 770]
MTNHECKECSADFDGFLTSDTVRTGFISGATFKNKPVQYSVVDGLAVFEGCIVLGTVEEMEQKTAAVRAGKEDDEDARGVFITGQQYRWKNGIVPYEIDPNLPNSGRVTDAIAHWQKNTSIRFVQRTSSNASQYPNYIYFRPADGCWSFVGMRGGKQDVGLANGCGLGATIHEIGHALGLWHEQSREDRDRHIQIHWENIQPGTEHNFNQHINDGDDYAAYDYDSIMHYGSTAFSKNGQPTITTIPAGKPIGQRNTLSGTDIATIAFLYSGKPPQSRPYTLKAGDTLYLVAQRELGNGDRWREIMKTPNGGFFTEEEARNLMPGQVIYLP